MSTPVKVGVIYYSATGTGTEFANTLVAEVEAAGDKVRLRRAPKLAPDAAIDSNPAWRANVEAKPSPFPRPLRRTCCGPTRCCSARRPRFGNIASQLKQFIDTLGGQWAQGQLADKVDSGFTSSSTAHGGQESTLLALYNTFHHFGGIVVAPGYTDGAKFADGNPYGTSHVDAQGANKVDDITRVAAAVQAKRVVAVARDLDNGANA
ncbi:NAD(P)H dehydrogenase [Saccharopolyspora sp. NPDC000995]